MKITELQAILAGLKHSHGDVEVFCGTAPVAAVVVLPATIIHPGYAREPIGKVISLVSKNPRSDRRFRVR